MPRLNSISEHLFTVNGGAIAAAGGGGGGSLTNVPTSPITVLFIGGDSSYPTSSGLLASLRTINTTLGYPTLTITDVTNSGDIGLTYAASSADVIFYESLNSPGTNTYNTINNFLLAGKGVVLFALATSGYGFSWTNTQLVNNSGVTGTAGGTYWQISPASSYTFANYAETVTDPTGTNSILYGVTTVYNQSLMSQGINGLTNSVAQSSYGSTVPGVYSSNVPNFVQKDYGSGSTITALQPRRVDISTGYTFAATGSDTTTNQLNRLILNAAYWAARKTL
jgi:hypothetical protein